MHYHSRKARVIVELWRWQLVFPALTIALFTAYWYAFLFLDREQHAGLFKVLAVAPVLVFTISLIVWCVLGWGSTLSDLDQKHNLGLWEPIWHIDWNRGISDFPEHGGMPPCGDCNRVAIDGQGINNLEILRLRTGRRGFVEIMLKTDVGGPLLRIAQDCSTWTELLPARIEGRVEYQFVPEKVVKVSG